MKPVKEYKYRVNLISINNEDENGVKGLDFEIANHDDLFRLLTLVQGKLGLDVDQEQGFLIGLKMFSEVLIKNRQNPLFIQMKQSMGEIMSILKNHIKKSSIARSHDI